MLRSRRSRDGHTRPPGGSPTGSVFALFHPRMDLTSEALPGILRGLLRVEHEPTNLSIG